MKIVSIDEQMTTGAIIAFHTDPPLSKEVFAEFREHWPIKDGYNFSEWAGLLLLDCVSPPTKGFVDQASVDQHFFDQGRVDQDSVDQDFVDQDFVDQIERHLVEAENAIEAKKNAIEAKKARSEAKLQELSKRLGLPITPGPNPQAR